jgi:colicin import membrane protein
MSLSEKPGLVVSSAAHVALLGSMLLSFSFDPKFQDAQETIPIEVMSSSDLNQIMKGDKTAKEVQPKQRADKVADTTEIKPQPPLDEAKKDVPTPPSPDKKLPDPGQADKPDPKATEAKAAPAAEQPKPVKPSPPLPTVTPPPPDAEAAEPQRPKDEPKKPDPAKLKLDQIAKLLEDKKLTDPKPAKPKSGDESPDRHKFDPNDISKVLLSKENAQRKAATNRELAQVASLGSPTASASRMSPSLMAQMEGWFQDRFQGCWTQPITIPPGQKYVPMIRVPLNLDGSLAGEPTLINPPNDPAWRPLAESALRAVRKCDPLPVPARFKPYYDEWRGRIVRFNDDAL